MGLTSNVSCSRTQHDDDWGDRSQDLSIHSPTNYHNATALLKNAACEVNDDDDDGGGKKEKKRRKRNT